MTTPNRGLVNSVENTLQPGVAFNWLADILDRRFGALTIDFAADATLELTQIQSDYSVLVFTDTGPVLTGPQDVEFPAAFPSMLVVNDTAQVLTMLKTGGTGVAVPVGASMRVSCGETDVLSQTADTIIAEPVNVLTPVAGVLTIDCSLGNYFTLAPTANITSTVLTNLPAAGQAQTITVQFTQDTSARSWAWPASFKWAGGVAGSVSTGSGAIDMVAFTTFDQGTTWLATIGKAFG